jgi:hypothetical protein
LKCARRPGYDDFVVPRALFVASLALLALGCDAGGLLLVEGTETKPPPPAAQGPAVTEFAASGNVAKNAKYRVVFTMGQPTPQSVAKSPANRLNGGMPGAAFSQ